MSLSNLSSNNGISANSELDLKTIRLTGTLSVPLVSTPYVSTQKIDLFGTSTITLGDSTHDGFIQGFTNKNLNINADGNLLVNAGTDTFISADTIYLRSAGVDKLVISNASNTFYNELNCNNTFIINGVGTTNPGMRIPGTGFDYFGVTDGQVILAPNGITPRFGCFDGFSAFTNDILLFDTTISTINYSLSQTGAVFNLPLTFPNFTTAQKLALTPAEGMVVFDTTLVKLQVYAGGAWVNLH
jgi:hypothetical protein